MTMAVDSELTACAELADLPGSFFGLFDDAPRWDALRGLPLAATTGHMASFFRPRRAGKGLYAPCLDNPLEGQAMVEGCLDFIRRHCSSARAMGDGLAEATAELTAQLASATCPHQLSLAAKLVHCNLTAWMYFVDDGVARWSARRHDEAGYPRLVLALVKHHLACWCAGLEGEAAPPHEGSLLTAGDVLRDDSASLFALGAALHACASQVRLLAPLELSADHLLDELAFLTRELESSLYAKVEEAAFAPNTPETYMARHSRTGHVRVCLELNLLTYAWQRGVTRAELTALPERLWCHAMNKTDHAVLRSNELCFVKDIGQPEESLMAVMIAAIREDEGEPLGRDLTNCDAHGKILEEYAATPSGFLALQRIVSDLRNDFSELVSAALELERCGGEALGARIANTVLLTWAFGYHFLNPISDRYGESFGVVMEVLNENLPGYIQTLEHQIRARHAAAQAVE